METLFRDLRYTWRALRRDLGFAIVAVLILGVGIGANTAIFSLVNALLIRPLPFPDAEHLVWIENDAGTAAARAAAAARTSAPPSLSGHTFRVLTFDSWRTLNTSFDEMGAYFAFYNYGSAKLTIGTETERLVDVGVTCTFFEALGVQPSTGRLFLDNECQQNGPKAVLISHRLWQSRFESDPSISGRGVTINSEVTTIVGVLPASFDFGSLFAPGTRADIFSPFAVDEEHDRWGNTVSIVGRLKRGVSIDAARADLAAITAELHRSRADRGTNYGARVVPLREHVSGSLRTGLIVLFCAVGAVLLIACANLSNLLLARAASRQQEIAVRSALGATRWRLVRQLLTESLVLSAAGAFLGLLIAIVSTRGVTRLRGFSLPLLQTVTIDGWALAFTIGIAIVTGVLFGLAPALQAASGRQTESLKENARGASDGARTTWTRRVLVVSEVALACVLLVTAGLLIRSFARVLDVNLGFRPERIAVLRVEPGPAVTNSAQRNAFYDEVVRRVEAVPGIEAAALTDALPLDRNRTWGIAARGENQDVGQITGAFVRVVSKGYFATMNIPILAGSDFNGRETPESEAMLILNQTAARRLWPGHEATGKIARTNGTDYRVIGVVGDVRHASLEKESGNEMYLPLTRVGPAGSADLVMRTTLTPGAMASTIRTALRPVDPTLPTTDVRLMQDLVDKAVSPRRFMMWLLTAFAVQALVLASLGIYGVVSYAVTERTREIGIRMALGASTGDVQRRVVQETLALAAAGAVLGLAGAWAARAVMSSLVYDVSATDPVTFAGMAVVLGAVAVLAGYIPARRASRIDPMSALRV